MVFYSEFAFLSISRWCGKLDICWGNPLSFPICCWTVWYSKWIYGGLCSS